MTPFLAAENVKVNHSPDSKTAQKPNIIYFIADDLGKYELGCYGQEKIKTPNIDSLAADGILFTQHYSGSPVCAPSRCVLMTGKHSGHAVIRDNHEIQPEGQRPIPEDSITLAKILKAQGYATGAFGKWGLGFVGSSGDPNKQGFDVFYGYNCQRVAHNYFPKYLWKNDQKVPLEGNDAKLTGKQYSHDIIMEEAKNFIRENKNQPFFLYVPFTIPHVALQTPENDPLLKEYQSQGWNDPPYTGGKGYLPHPTPRAAYAAMVTRMDRSVGEVLALLEELGLSENTLVIFTSDNGPTFNGGSDSTFFCSAKNLRGLKGDVFEGGISVPLVMKWKGKIAPGRTSNTLSAFYDMMPTFAEMTGAELPPGTTDGISLLPTILDSGSQQKHEFLIWDFPGFGGQQAVRFGDWKAVRRGLNHNPHAPIQLFNLKEDPSEKKNVAAEHPEIVKEADALLKREIIPLK